MIFDMGKNAHKYKPPKMETWPLLGIDVGRLGCPVCFQKEYLNTPMTATEAKLLRGPLKGPPHD